MTGILVAASQIPSASPPEPGFDLSCRLVAYLRSTEFEKVWDGKVNYLLITHHYSVQPGMAEVGESVVVEECVMTCSDLPKTRGSVTGRRIHGIITNCLVGEGLTINSLSVGTSIYSIAVVKMAESAQRYEWVPHGEGWALMLGAAPNRHGLNVLTVGADGFDARGAELRERIVRLLNDELDRADDPLLGCSPFLQLMVQATEEADGFDVRIEHNKLWLPCRLLVALKKPPEVSVDAVFETSTLAGLHTDGLRESVARFCRRWDRGNAVFHVEVVDH